MKNTQQHLLIQDLDYCNIVCDDAEEIIVGGFFRKLFFAARDEVKDTVKATVTVVGDLLATGQSQVSVETGIDLLVPYDWRVWHRFRNS